MSLYDLCMICVEKSGKSLLKIVNFGSENRPEPSFFTVKKHSRVNIEGHFPGQSRDSI